MTSPDPRTRACEAARHLEVFGAISANAARRLQSLAACGEIASDGVADGGELIKPVRSFLSAPRCAVLATIASDGAPRQIVIHYLLGADHLRPSVTDIVAGWTT